MDKRKIDSSVSPSDAATIDYLEEHNILELVDSLICEVAVAQPKEPVPFMAEILLRRISARHRDQHLSANNDNALLVAALPLPARRRNSSEGSSLHRERVAHFGIWFNVYYDDLNKIAKQYQSSVASQRLSIPPEFDWNLVFLLQMIATAHAIEYYRGFQEAVKLLPLRPDSRVPRASEELAHIVIEFAPNSTASQRLSFMNFMQRVSNHFAETDVAEMSDLRDRCIALRQNPAAWEAFTQCTERELRLIDPALVARDDSCRAFLDSFFDSIASTPLHDDKAVKCAFSKVIEKTILDYVPDRVVMFSAVISIGLTHSSGFPTELVASLENSIRGSVIEAANRAAAEFYGTRECVRQADMSLLYTLKHFLGNNSFRAHYDTQAFGQYLQSNVPSYSDAMVSAFAATAGEVLQLPLPVREGEGYGMRCVYPAYRCLLKLLVTILHCRHETTLSEVLLYLARSLCCGAPPALLYVHFQFAFNHTQSVTPPQLEMAKQMLSALQELCLMALRLPITRSIADSLILLDDLARSRPVLTDYVNSTFPSKYMTPETLVNFLQGSEILKRLVRCFANPSEKGVEKYFGFCTLLGGRLKLCGVHNTWMTEFVSSAMLAAIHQIARSSPIHPLLPAMEALVGMGPCITMCAQVRCMPHDRRELLTYIQTNRTNRLLMMSVEELLRMFPEYRPRVLRKSFSLERYQQEFMALVMDILSSPDTDLTCIIRPYAVSLAAAGMLPRDYDLFGMALAHVLRAPGFPEREWLAVYMNVAEQFLNCSPAVRSLEWYSDHLGKIVKAQAVCRSWLVRNQKTERKAYTLQELRRALTEFIPEDDINLFSSVLRRERVILSPLDRKVIYLSWNSLEEETQAMLIYAAVRSPTVLSQAGNSNDSLGAHQSVSLVIPSSPVVPPTPDDSMELSQDSQASANHRREVKAILDRCHIIAANFTTLVTALYTEPSHGSGKGVGEEGWVVLWQELYGNDVTLFFDRLVPAPFVRSVGIHIIEGVCRRVNLNHPGIRSAWVTFMGCLLDRIEPLV